MLIRRLLPLEAMAFFIVDEDDQVFNLMDCEPKEAWEKLQKEKDQFVEDGTLAWLLRQFKPVMLPARNFDHQALLHVISTKSRTWGVFIGILPEGEKSVYDPALNLLSIALMNCAGALESFVKQQLERVRNVRAWCSARCCAHEQRTTWRITYRKPPPHRRKTERRTNIWCTQNGREKLTQAAWRKDES